MELRKYTVNAAQFKIVLLSVLSREMCG